MTITRKRHALEGRALPVISTIRRRGIHYLLAVLPDGSRSLIPSSWTDYNMQPVGPTDADEALHDLGRIREGPVQCRERLGGLLRYYHQEAA